MIVNSFRCYLPQTVHDHGSALAKPISRCIRHRYDRSE